MPHHLHLGIDVVYDVLREIPILNQRIYKLHAPPGIIRPFVILNTAFGITHQTLQNPAVIVGEGIKLDFYANTTDESNPNSLHNIFNLCHDALIKSRRMLSMATQYTFEDNATPDTNFNVVNAIYRMTVIYRIRTN